MWGPCAVAAQFMGDLPTAIAMMDKFITTLRQSNNDMQPSELSELVRTPSVLALWCFVRACPSSIVSLSSAFVVTHTSDVMQLFYKLDLLVLSGDHAGALQFLLHEEPHCVEKRRVREQHVALLLALGRPSEAVTLAAELLRINSEDLRYHTYVQQSRQVAGNIDALVALYTDELQKQFPRSAACQRIPLDFLPASDARFAQQFTTYYRRLLDKGAPSGE